MEHIAKLICGRKSVRTFDGAAVRPEDLERLTAFFRQIRNPFDVPVEFRLLSAAEHGLSSPVVTGAAWYIGAKVRHVPGAEEAFGYSFEQLVLYAWSLGLGTVWIGGTMDRPAFERAMELTDGEMMPCVSPLGYPAKKKALRENMMRKAVRADSRMDFGSLFFEKGFETPLAESRAGILREPLELVRWAPSAVNKQPWRAVVMENAVHFYKKQSRGFVGAATGDLQKIDLGIALCHFDLAAREAGLDLEFSRRDPGLKAEAGMEYIASYLLPSGSFL